MRDQIKTLKAKKPKKKESADLLALKVAELEGGLAGLSERVAALEKKPGGAKGDKGERGEKGETGPKRAGMFG